MFFSFLCPLFLIVKALNAIYFSLKTIFPSLIGYGIKSFLFIIFSIVCNILFDCIQEHDFNCIFVCQVIFNKSTLTILLVLYCCITNYLKLSTLQEQPFIISHFQWVNRPGELNWVLCLGLCKAKVEVLPGLCFLLKALEKIHFQACLEFTSVFQFPCSAFHL